MSLLSLSLLAIASVVAATTVTTNHLVAVNQTFDYVVVGGGLTGITVANKLTGKGYTVLIIEAGPDARNAPAVYNAEERSNLGTYCNWKYPAYGEDGTLLSWAIDSGACIGGSTSINGMVWYRPTKAEINSLELLGNPGWNWNALEPYMKAIEHNIAPNADQIAGGAAYDPAVHGTKGLVNTSFPTPMRIPEAQKLYKEALPLVFPGLTIGNDLSNRTSTVSASTSWTIWYDPVTQKNKRSSAADALLFAQSQQRSTLTVLAEHMVDKVIFDAQLGAKGVLFGNKSIGELYQVYARKEVLLAAGSLASAPILERSGIGSKTILANAGVKQLVDLPGVGANLNDQPGTGASALVVDSLQSDAKLIDGRNLFAPEISLVNIDELFDSNATQVAKELYQGLDSRAKALVDAGAAANIAGARAVLGTAMNLTVKNRLPVAEFIGESYPAVLTAVFWPLTPLSRGHVHISSSAPFAVPHVVPRLLTDAFDQSVAIAVTRKARALFSSMPFSSVVADAYADPSTSVVSANAGDAEVFTWYKSTAYGASHWIGSTAMMPRELGGVVDPELRVYGTMKLRVIDAGILPFQLTSHSMSTLYATSQKAADIILSDA